MDNCTDKQYMKLKVKRKRLPSKSFVNHKTLMNDAHDDDNGNNENFKINRFMKDVKKFCNHPSAEEYDDYKAHDVLKTCKDKIKEKGETVKGIGFNFKVKGNFNEKHHKQRHGIFERGVMTKEFQRGLMPPSLTARLNEDLRKMIELANGGSYKKVTDKMTNEDVTIELAKRGSYKKVTDKMTNEDVTIELANRGSYKKTTDKMINEDGSRLKQFNQESCDRHCAKEMNSQSPNVVEAEVQVYPDEGNDSQKIKSDHYLQFTHFVTRSLFNSGIDKQEIKSYSDSIKESLTRIYHSRMSENNSSEDLKVGTPDYHSENFTYCSTKTPSNCNQLLQATRTSYSSPSTCKSDEGPRRTKFKFISDSQLSDDVVIRKPVNKLYASGLDYLKAVYSENPESNRKYLPNTIRSSSSTRQDPMFTSSYNTEAYCCTNNIYESNNLNRHEHSSQYLSRGIDSYNKENINKCDNSFCCDPSTSLQYFPGNNNRLNNHLWNDNVNNNNVPFSSHNSAFKTGNNQEQPLAEESPKYISLLPSNHRLYNNVMTNSNIQSGSYSANLNDSVGRKVIHPLLSLPVHLPPRKSPDIQYIPRKMF